MGMLIQNSLGNWVFAEEFFLLPKISEIWQADGSPNKEKATKDLKYIHFVGHPLSAYNRRYAEKDVEKLVRDEVLLDSRYKPTKKVLEALEWYKGFVRTKDFTTFDMLDKVIEGIQESISKTNWTTLDAATIEKYMKIANSIGATKQALRKARVDYEASLIGNSVTKKGTVSKWEVPKKERK